MSTISPASTRRELLKRGGALGLTSLGGCACPWPSLPLGDVPALRPGPLAPPPSQGGSLELPIVIDAHCHIFNVEDVPASPMLKGPIAHAVTRTFGKKLIAALADVVSAIAYFLAPSARGELQMLKELSARYVELVRMQSPDAAGAAIANLLKGQIEQFSRAFAIAARDPRFAVPYLHQLQAYHSQRAKGAAQAAPGIERELSEDRIRRILTEQHGFQPMAFDPSDPFNLVRFAFTLTSPRCLNLAAMQRAYSGGRGIPAVGVFCPSLLDLDHWLGCKDTATVQDDQVRLMEQIAVMSGGTTMPFVGFNPRSDLVRDGASFDRVVDAISNRGFIGVKLYPPMGYLAYGNGCQDRHSACPTMKDAREIDARLFRLYEWCSDHNVPIMSHTSHSFGSTDAHDDCASPVGWQRALERFPGLRVQAGHFGGDSVDALANGWAAEYVRMMGMPNGHRLYADLSNLGDLFVDGSRVREVIQPLFTTKLSEASAEIGADRLVYGSDWYMTQLAGDAGACVEKMSTYLEWIERKFEIPKLRDRVFGLNAERLYGLAADPGNGRATNRDRLKRYYADKGITPAWMDWPGARHGSGDSGA